MEKEGSFAEFSASQTEQCSSMPTKNIFAFWNFQSLLKLWAFQENCHILYCFGHLKQFPPKFKILIVKIYNDLRLVSNIRKWQNLLNIWPKNGKICQNSFNRKRPKKGYVGPFLALILGTSSTGTLNSNQYWMSWEGVPRIKARQGQLAPLLGVFS